MPQQAAARLRISTSSSPLAPCSRTTCPLSVRRRPIARCHLSTSIQRFQPGDSRDQPLRNRHAGDAHLGQSPRSSTTDNFRQRPVYEDFCYKPDYTTGSWAQDLQAVATTAARIAHCAAYIRSTSATSASSDRTRRPWPTQTVAFRRQGTPRSDAAAPRPDNISLPPQAPDGTFTEMKHVNARIDSTSQLPPSKEEVDEARKQLDETMAAYFGGGPPEQQREQSGMRVDPAPSLPQAEEEIVTQMSPQTPVFEASIKKEPVPDTSSVKEAPAKAESPKVQPVIPSQPLQDATPPPQKLTSDLNLDEEDALIPEYDATAERRNAPLRASKVPSSRIARLMHYGTLGAGLAWSAAGSYLRTGQPADGAQRNSALMSESNIKRLVDKLGKMRGAALKLGQFLSIQDSNLLPPQIEAVLTQVQNSADYMPEWQMERVMTANLGTEWRSQFASFDSTPFAAASIGQVHHGVLPADHPTHPNVPVAVKVQFPGVRESIESDLSYLKWLLHASALLPKGLFLENTINQMRLELEDECDYEREADMCHRFGQIFNTKPGSLFQVPAVVHDLCGRTVLTTEMMQGRPLSKIDIYSADRRNRLATALLELSLSELFRYRLMQTDPNFSNFLYAPATRKLQLIDFGATREYSKAFMDDWLRLLICAVNKDYEGCKQWSIKVGYLLGTESEEMVRAHIDSMVLLGSPFRQQEPFDFTYQTLTDEIKAHIPLMLAQRQTPPPKETYSLNRKLSGTFLLASKLKASVSCQEVLKGVVEGYLFDDGSTVSFRDGRLETVPAQSAQGLATPSRISAAAANVRAFHTLSGPMREKNGAHVPQMLRVPAQTSRREAMQRKEEVKKVRQRYGINLGNRWPHSAHVRTETGHLDVAPPTTPSGPRIVNGPIGQAQTSEGVPSRTAGSEGPTPPQPPPPVGPATSTAEANPPPLSASAVVPHASVRGITLPTKPPAPGAEDCCMSGCARCVYDLYQEDLSLFSEDVSAVRTKLEAAQPPLSSAEWDVVEGTLGIRGRSEEKKGEADHGAKAEEEVGELIAGLDPTMKAFLEMERAMKKKQAQKLGAK